MNKFINAEKKSKAKSVKSQFNYQNTGAIIRAKLDGKLEFKNKDKYINKIEALLHREMDALPKNNIPKQDKDNRYLEVDRMAMTLKKVTRNY